MDYNPNCGRCGMLNSAGYCQLTACMYPAGTQMPVPVVFRPTTNGERLRWKSDEELAQWIGETISEKINSVVDGGEAKSINDWLDWLRQEANDVGQ